MKPASLIKIGLATVLLPLAAWAQTPATTTSATTFDPGTPPAPGTLEFTIGGNGAANKDLDSSFGGLNFSVGQYLNATSLVVLRQSVNYSNPSPGGKSWGGSTRVAYDVHILPSGAVRPFVGVNLGGIYGDAIRDSWAGGLEGGAKFYVIPRTFVYAMAEYAWLFRRAKDINNQFNDGAFNFSVGVGFHF
ncbi:MAG: hypothetical protein ABIO94_14050 [Opitutaceae bacterium]